MKRKGFKPPQGVSVAAGILVMVGVAVLIGWQLGNFILDWATTPSGEGIRLTADDIGGINTSTGTSSTSNINTTTPSNSMTSQTGTSYPSTTSPSTPVTSSTGLYKVQVGSFETKSAALVTADKLRANGYEVYVTSLPPYKVQVGAFKDQKNASNLYTELEERGYDVRISFVATQ